MKFRAIIGLFVAFFISTQAVHAQIELRFSAVGVQNTLLPSVIPTPSTVSSADFTSQTVGNPISSIPLIPGTNGVTGTFNIPTANNAWVVETGIFGGAGNGGNYLIASAPGPAPSTFTLNLSGEAGYLGLYVGSLDAFNEMRFYKGNEQVGQFNAPQLLTIPDGMGGLTQGANDGEGPLPDGHYGNPSRPDAVATTDPFVYLNFFAEDTASKFDRVVFTQLNGGAFEIDNVAVHSDLFDGDDLPNSTSIGFIPVPEPTGIVAVGVIVIVLGARMRKRLLAKDVA